MNESAKKLPLIFFLLSFSIIMFTGTLNYIRVDFVWPIVNLLSLLTANEFNQSDIDRSSKIFLRRMRGLIIQLFKFCLIETLGLQPYPSLRAAQINTEFINMTGISSLTRSVTFIMLFDAIF